MTTEWLLAAVALVLFVVAVTGLFTVSHLEARIRVLEARHAHLLDAVIRLSNTAELIAGGDETRGQAER